VTPELVAKAHAAGLAVNAWTANDPADIVALVTLGVDGICSDFPERVPKG
jgi:glycerophosphoryl diester phosphodiesterase